MNVVYVVVLVIFLLFNRLKLGRSFLMNSTFEGILSTKVNVLKQMFNPEPNFFGRNIESECEVDLKGVLKMVFEKFKNGLEIKYFN